MESSPEPAGGTEYAAYLLIDDLLELQRPLTPEAHDELLFIIVHQARIAALADLYLDHVDDPVRALRHEVCELVVDHDEGVQRWRFHHTLMAAREIGSREGTGGSRGVEYLRGTVDRRFYEELWAVRVAL